MKAVIYARVSSLTQAKEWDWINWQITTCKYFCDTHKLEIDKIFSDEWVSGKISDRKWLNELIEYLSYANKNETSIKFIVVYDLDRISRDLEWWFHIRRIIEDKYKAKIISTKWWIDKNINTELMQNINMVFAEHWRKENRERVMSRQKARLLDWYRTFASIPWYKYIKDTWRWGKILIQNEHASILKAWLEKYAKNILQTLTDLLLYLEEQWFTSLKKSKTIKYDVIKRVLSQDRLYFYAWYINVPSRDINMIEWKHEPIISIATAKKIIEKQNPKKYCQRSQNQDILESMVLRNYLLCEWCHKPLSWWPSRWKLWKIYNYYRCFNVECQCYGKSLNADTIHSAFENYLQQYSLEKDFIDVMFDVMQEVYNEEEKKNNKEQVLLTTLQQISKKISLLQDRILNTNDTTIITQYESSLSQLLIEQKTIKDSIMQYKANKVSLEEKKKEILEIIEYFWDLYTSWRIWDYHRRRLLIGVVMSGKIYFNKKKGITTPELSFIYAVYSEFKKPNSCLVKVAGFEPASESHAIQCLPS